MLEFLLWLAEMALFNDLSIFGSAAVRKFTKISPHDLDLVGSSENLERFITAVKKADCSVEFCDHFGDYSDNSHAKLTIIRRSYCVDVDWIPFFSVLFPIDYFEMSLCERPDGTYRLVPIVWDYLVAQNNKVIDPLSKELLFANCFEKIKANCEKGILEYVPAQITNQFGLFVAFKMVLRKIAKHAVGWNCNTFINRNRISQMYCRKTIQTIIQNKINDSGVAFVIMEYAGPFIDNFTKTPEVSICPHTHEYSDTEGCVFVTPCCDRVECIKCALNWINELSYTIDGDNDYICKFCTYLHTNNGNVFNIDDVDENNDGIDDDNDGIDDDIDDEKEEKTHYVSHDNMTTLNSKKLYIAIQKSQDSQDLQDSQDSQNTKSKIFDSIQKLHNNKHHQRYKKQKQKQLRRNKRSVRNKRN